MSDSTMRLHPSGITVMFVRNENGDIDVLAGTILVEHLPAERNLERQASRWMRKGGIKRVEEAVPFIARSGAR